MRNSTLRDSWGQCNLNLDLGLPVAPHRQAVGLAIHVNLHRPFTRGHRSGEPVGIERETSVLWKKLLTIRWQEIVSRNDISEELGLVIDELESLIGSMTVTEPGRRSIMRGSFDVV
ncbi:hypothetical protein SDC9_31458 [bioreactor metagenome]|uniref:Uncharacterized protein n=1 Tax=bioreactor metagenome TaxID=1076179 RepID=A0A644V2D2_9ZZZZ